MWNKKATSVRRWRFQFLYLLIYRTCLSDPANAGPNRHHLDDFLIKQREVIERLAESFLTQINLTINRTKLPFRLLAVKRLCFISVEKSNNHPC